MSRAKDEAEIRDLLAQIEAFSNWLETQCIDVEDGANLCMNMLGVIIAKRAFNRERLEEGIKLVQNAIAGKAEMWFEIEEDEK